MGRKEPYESQAGWIIVFGLLTAAAAFFLGAGLWALAVAGIFLLGSQLWPFLMEAGRRRADVLVMHGQRPRSCLKAKPIAETADSEDGPGKFLYAFGGGGPIFGWAWTDGGKPYARGGYVSVPKDLVVEIPGMGVYLAAHVVELRRIGQYNAHFQAAIVSNGFHPENTEFYDADYGVVSLIPPSEKVIDRQSLDISRREILSEHRDLTDDVIGHEATKIDLWAQARGSIEGRSKRSILRPKKESEPQEGQDQQND